MPGTAVLVRHGESVANARGLFTGVIDVGLTSAGERDCTLAGARLLGAGWRPDVIVTSELARGWRTAELVGAALGGQVPVERDWRLNERNYGALSGYLKTEVVERFGHERFLYWRRSYTGRPPPLDARTLALWRRLPPFDRQPPAALTPTESLADVVARLAPCWRTDLEPRLRAGQDVLVVAHGNSLRALCAVLDGLTPDELSVLNLPNARPLMYELTEGADSLVPALRGGRYLDPEAAATEAAQIAAQGGT